MAQLDFTDKTQGYTDDEKEYIRVMLAGANNEELHARFGPKAFELKGNNQLNKYIADVKLKRKLRKHLVDDSHAEEYVKLIPNAIKIINNAMAQPDKVSEKQISSARFVLGPVSSYLKRLFENIANEEVAAVELTSEGFKLIVNRLDGKTT